MSTATVPTTVVIADDRHAHKPEWGRDGDGDGDGETAGRGDGETVRRRRRRDRGAEGQMDRWTETEIETVRQRGKDVIWGDAATASITAHRCA